MSFLLTKEKANGGCTVFCFFWATSAASAAMVDEWCVCPELDMCA